MRHPIIALLASFAAAGPPATAQDMSTDPAYVLRCHFIRSCIGGGCGEEDYDTLLEIDGAAATFRDAQVELPMLGGFDPLSGQVSFASEPADDAAYFITVFEDGAAILSIHARADGDAVGITFDGACREDI
ncbi:hypothetical protein [Frigidibacter oleivorans]|uniref:hypothetical protein n=1 Tax=Frigidibacter oleivorans TaxID=2487129 RepID=UPI000F8D221A|nr:hypothetical protein [Frigidibacter oleivorans]